MLLGNSCLAVVAGRLERMLRCFLLAAVLVSASASSAGLERVGSAVEYCDAFEDAAMDDDGNAQLQLAHCYLNGEGRPRDLAKAESLLLDSIEAGNVRALSSLGSLLMFERQERFSEAVHLFAQAVERDLVWANFQLGIAYKNGCGVARNERAALNHFKLAADADHPLSMIMLIAASKFRLMASPPDLAQAEYWQGRLPIALRRSGVPSVEEYAKVLSNDQFVLEYLLSEGQLRALVEELSVNN